MGDDMNELPSKKLSFNASDEDKEGDLCVGATGKRKERFSLLLVALTASLVVSITTNMTLYANAFRRECPSLISDTHMPSICKYPPRILGPC
jgi:hypothetical protein